MRRDAPHLRCCDRTRQALASLISKHRKTFLCFVIFSGLSCVGCSSTAPKPARPEDGGEGLGGHPSWVHILRAAAMQHTTERRHGTHPTDNATEDSTYLNLVWIGMAFGIVHVITGPDHVSAMVTLAAGQGSKAFWLGARWGAGHSLGLIIMYIALLAAGDAVFESADVVDKIVGFVMIVLGGIGMFAAFRDHRQEREQGERGGKEEGGFGLSEVISDQSSPLRLSGRDRPLSGRDQPLSGRDRPLGAPRDHARDTSPDSKLAQESWGRGRYSGREGEKEEAEGGLETEKGRGKGEGGGGDGRSCDPLRVVPDTVSLLQFPPEEHSGAQGSEGGARDATHHSLRSVAREKVASCLASGGFCAKERLLSVLVGIIHGMAGPGGVLGVLPAVHQRDLRRGCVYIGAFSAATVAGMAGFAAMWGHLTGPEVVRPGSKIKLWVQLASAGLSVAVGVLWVTLAFLGRLDDLFGHDDDER